jgi:hypothetical protein
MTTVSPCRTYIVYRNALFAQGVRSVLERESDVQIIGMENDAARAAAAVRALCPEVILVEEPVESGTAWPFLEWANASCVVTFSLHHAYATVYSPHRTAAYDPVDLVRAIQGARTREESPETPSDARGRWLRRPTGRQQTRAVARTGSTAQPRVLKGKGRRN